MGGGVVKQAMSVAYRVSNMIPRTFTLCCRNKALSVENHQQKKVLSLFKPGVGLNTALHASSAAMNSALAISTFAFHLTSFFSTSSSTINRRVT